MSEENSKNEAKQTDEKNQQQTEKFDRGSVLSIFGSDRIEDFIALAFALIIAVGVYFLV